jgi:class 3 adenylate cyclase
VADVGDLERRLEAARAQQQAIGRVLRAVARADGLQAVLDEVVEAVTLLSGVDNGRLWLVEDGQLRAFANHGFSETFYYDREHPHAIDRTTMAGRTALLRGLVHVPDVLEDPEYEYAGPRPYRAALSVPILFEEELIGVIGIVRATPGPFAEEHVELVQLFAEQAAIAITNARLLEAVERQRSELSRFLSPQVAELVSSEDGKRLLTGHRAYISVLFCDLRGFTAFAETAEPEELLDVLRTYHTAIGELIPEYGGTLEHFAGDGLMVFFNDPVPVDEHELQAIRLALAAQERLAELDAGWRKRGTELGLGIGIAAGYATLGRIGFEGRYDYGALGTVTNLASRLSSSAQAGQTLISQRVYAAVDEAVESEPVGELELKGFARPVPAYAVRRVLTT